MDQGTALADVIRIYGFFNGSTGQTGSPVKPENDI
ncbi:hypothetical protein IWQ55_006366 [Labrenzia sp. EL_208]|nr:hypothetical protein [Labrenzia sp. EL_132]MBG6233131.1 hypothetical protein [Labrenzia sp. EL_208]